MKLMAVWHACATSQERPISAWASLASLKKPPKVAYLMLNYGTEVSKEYDVIEQQRRTLVYQAAGVPEGSDVKIEPGSPEFNQFIQSFNDFLSVDANLKPVGLSMGELIDALDSEKGNAISEQDLELLKPFFQEKAA